MPQGLTIAGAHVLAHGFGLEVVVVSFAATIDETGAGILLLIVPPTMKKRHAGARFFRHGAYVCRETPDLSNTSAQPPRKQLILLSLETTRHGMEQAPFPLSHSGAQIYWCMVHIAGRPQSGAVGVSAGLENVCLPHSSWSPSPLSSLRVRRLILRLCSQFSVRTSISPVTHLVLDFLFWKMRMQHPILLVAQGCPEVQGRLPSWT